MVTIANSTVSLLTGQAAGHILRLAERATTPAEFKQIVEMISTQAPVAWRPFGWDGSKDGGRVPHSAVGAAADPAHLLAEPVMNSFDSLFELEMRLKALGSAPSVSPASPREAAHLLFGVHADGMAAWDARRGEGRQLYEQLARLTLVKLVTRHSRRDPYPRLSGRRDRPTSCRLLGDDSVLATRQ